MISLQNYIGSKQKSHKFMRFKMFKTLDKVKPDTGNMRLKLGGCEDYDQSSASISEHT